MLSRKLTNFFVSTLIIDQNGQEVSVIDPDTQTYSHVIKVENCTRVPRDAKVEGFLPNYPHYLAFEGPSNTHIDKWEQEISRVPPTHTRDKSCPLVHIRAATYYQPVHCEQVWTKRGAGKYVPDVGPLPLALYVTVI